MLRKEKKRQRRLLRGVMNSACYWFSLYQKVKDKMYYNYIFRSTNPRVESRLKNIRQEEYLRALNNLIFSSIKKYGRNPIHVLNK